MHKLITVITDIYDGAVQKRGTRIWDALSLSLFFSHYWLWTDQWPPNPPANWF